MANAPHYAKGRYVGKILNQALSKASTGTPQLVIRFKVMGVPDPKDPTAYIPDPQQYERTLYRALTEGTMQYVIEDLKTLGFTGESFRLLDPSTPNFYDMTGMDVDFYCNHETGQDGGMREKWGLARAPSEFKVETLEPAKMRELDNLFGKQLKEAFKPAAQPKAKAQTKPQPAAEMAAVGATDDDIPF
jgi:hypothetical protein